MTTTDKAMPGYTGRLAVEAFEHARMAFQTRALVRVMLDSVQRLGNGTEASRADLCALLDILERMTDDDHNDALTMARALESRARQNPGS